MSIGNFQERNIIYKIRHESFDSNTLKNDIALFKMDETVDTSVYVPVCLPAHGEDYVGKTGETNFFNAGSITKQLNDLF